MRCSSVNDFNTKTPVYFDSLVAEKVKQYNIGGICLFQGNPVKLARNLWAEALELRGDVGARGLVHDRVVSWVDCTDTGSAADIDTLEDLARLQQQEDQ